MSNRNNNIIPEPGFSLVEMLIVIPIVIIMIGVFVTAIVTMTGDVLSTRASNALAYNIQDALSRIKNDVKLSGAFLATNDIILTSPQGYNNDTTYFHNANSDPEVGTILILKTYATTSNPLTSTQNIMYLSGQPNACSSPIVNQNTPLTLNTIYFIKNNTLWRRVVAPSYYATVGCIGSSVGTPWQQPSCAVGITGTMCKTQDERLVDGVQPSDFNVSYYTSPGSTTANTIAGDSTQTDAARQAALRESSTISVTINGTSTVAGQDISQSGTIREISPNNIQPINYQSCSSIFKTGGSVGDGSYWINPAGTAFQVYCDMTTNGGGWTLVMRMANDTTLQYDASNWISGTLINQSTIDATTNTNSVFDSYNLVQGTMIMGCRGANTNCVSATYPSFSSARSLVTGATQWTASMTRASWISIFPPDNPTEPNCNIGGINIYPSGNSKARFGFSSNNENDCASNDNAWGFGIYGYAGVSCGAGVGGYGLVQTCYQGTLYVK